jgi:hypothetical protein
MLEQQPLNREARATEVGHLMAEEGGGKRYIK